MTMTFDPAAALVHCERVEALLRDREEHLIAEQRFSEEMKRKRIAFLSAWDSVFDMAKDARTGWPETAALLRAAVEEVKRLLGVIERRIVFVRTAGRRRGAAMTDYTQLVAEARAQVHADAVEMDPQLSSDTMMKLVDAIEALQRERDELAADLETITKAPVDYSEYMDPKQLAQREKLGAAHLARVVARRDCQINTLVSMSVKREQELRADRDRLAAEVAKLKELLSKEN